MNPEAKKELKRILEKAKTDPLEDYEIDFLRARRIYIKKSKLKYVGKFLEVTKAGKKKRAEKVITKVEQKELDDDEMNRTTHPAEKREQTPYRQLQNRARRLGLKFVGVTRKKLEESILATKKK